MDMKGGEARLSPGAAAGPQAAAVDPLLVIKRGPKATGRDKRHGSAAGGSKKPKKASPGAPRSVQHGAQTRGKTDADQAASDSEHSAFSDSDNDDDATDSDMEDEQEKGSSSTWQVDRVMVYAAGLAVFIAVAPLLFTGGWHFLITWDDDANFVYSDMLSPVSWSNIRRWFTESVILVYEPFSLAVKAMLIAVFGMSSRAIRIAGAIAHLTGCTALGLATLRALSIKMPRVRVRVLTSASVGAATLYAVHPLMVEVVGWPSAAPYTFAACNVFCTLAAISLQWHTRLDRVRPAVFDRFCSEWMVAGLYCCAVMSKSAAVLLPFGVLALDFGMHGHDARLANKPLRVQVQHVLEFILINIRKRWQMWSLMVLFMFLTIYFNIDPEGTRTFMDIIHLSMPQRLAKLFVTPAFMLLQFFVPVGLRPHHRIAEGSLTWFDASNASALVAFSYMAVVIVFGFSRMWKQSWVLASVAWYFIMHAPTVGLIQHGMVQFGGDRYAYLPCAVLVPLLAALFVRCYQGDTSSDRWLSRTVACMLLVIAGVCFHKQIGVWRNDDGLWHHSLKFDAGDWRAWNSLVDLVTNRDGVVAARPFIERAVMSQPDPSTVKAVLHCARGHYLLGNLDAACAMYSEALRTLPDAQGSGEIISNLGVCALRDQHTELARSLLNKAAEMLPQSKQVVGNAKGMAKWDAGQDYDGHLIY